MPPIRPIRRPWLRAAAGLTLIAAPAAAHAAPDDRPAPIWVKLPSGAPSGEPRNDEVPVLYFAARDSGKGPAPAVVLLHPLGTKDLRLMRRFGRFLAARGIGSAIMELPYHLDRRLPGEKPQQRYTGPDVQQGIRALGQAAADTSVVVDWLREQPGVDPARIGAVGASLGAVVSHLAMGKDERLTAGVALLGGGDLPYLRHRSFLFNFPRRARPLTAAELELAREVDPLTYADRNRPRHVLMVQAARDIVVPPRSGRELWKALGRPPIRWLDTGHTAALFAPNSAMRATSRYLHAAWAEGGAPAAAPPVYAPTLKIGTIIGLDSIATPALTWQAYSFRQRRNHMSLLHGDLGWTGRGPFLGLAATLNAYVDLGVGHRLGGAPLRPYASVHVVF